MKHVVTVDFFSMIPSPDLSLIITKSSELLNTTIKNLINAVVTTLQTPQKFHNRPKSKISLHDVFFLFLASSSVLVTFIVITSGYYTVKLNILSEKNMLSLNIM